MAAIGAISCTYLRGTFPALKARTLRWNVPGIDGYGLQVLGDGDAGCGLSAVLISSDALVDVWYVLLQAAQGTIVAATNDHGDVTAALFLQRVGRLRKTPHYDGVNTTRGQVALEGVIVA